MCDDNDNNYEQLLKEYGGIVKGLFSLLLEHLHHSHDELLKLKLENERRVQDEQMKAMREAMNLEV